MSALAIAQEHAANAELFREFAYPDPLSPLAAATRGMRLRWGFRPAREILAELPPEIAALDGAPWTVGFGQTGATVTQNSRCDEIKARTTLVTRLRALEVAVLKLLTPRASSKPWQVAAIMMLADNVGIGPVSKSTLIKLLNAGDEAGAAAEFAKFNKGRNRKTGELEVVQGLVNRRAKERALFDGKLP